MSPFNCIQVCSDSSAIQKYFPLAVHTFGIDRQHDALRAEIRGGKFHNIWIPDGSCIYRDLVGSGLKKFLDVLYRRDPATDRERNIDPRSDPFNEGSQS